MNTDKPDFKKLATDHYDRVGRNPDKKLDHHEIHSYAKGYQDSWLALQSKISSLEEENKMIKAAFQKAEYFDYSIMWDGEKSKKQIHEEIISSLESDRERLLSALKEMRGRMEICDPEFNQPLINELITEIESK